MAADLSPLLVFHHIPKTAGTSFRTALFNLFGEANCTHLTEIDFLTGDNVSAGLQRGAQARMVCGHIPARYVAADRRDVAVTFLRDPIDRVLSLYRFMLGQAPNVREHVGLGATFTLREFLDCRHSDVVSQIDNGMCRFLAQEAGLWPIDGPTDGLTPVTMTTLYSALDALDGMIVGICEHMDSSLALLSAELGLAAPLIAADENRAHARGDEPSADEIAEIAARNVLDTALYRDALARFEHRRRFPKERKQPIAPPATLRPGEYRIDQLPARAGFNAFEPAPRLSWLSKGARARLHFLVGDEPVSGFSIRIYTGAHDYPVQNASFLVNGASPPLDWRAGGDNWGTAFVGPFKPSHGLNTLEIHTAERDTTASAPALDPRSLTFGVSTIQVK